MREASNWTGHLAQNFYRHAVNGFCQAWATGGGLTQACLDLADTAARSESYFGASTRPSLGRGATLYLLVHLGEIFSDRKI